MNKLDKIRGSFLGVAAGDALGMPAQGLKREELLFITDNEGITDFVGPIIYYDIPFEDRTFNYCSTTDNWKLTKIVAKSLLQISDFDLLHQALYHVSISEEINNEFEKAHQENISAIKKYIDSYGRLGKSPYSPPLTNQSLGNGNGVAAKVSPLAMLSWFRQEETAFALQLGKLTHASDEALDGALLLELMIRYSADFDGQDSRIFDQQNLSKALQFLYNGQYDVQSLIYAKGLSLLQNYDTIMTKPISFTIDLLGNGFTAHQSIPLALAIAFRNGMNFSNGILEAVNYSKDSNTVGSMVGALLGAKLGFSQIALKWRKPEFQEALTLADLMYGVFA